MSTWPQDDNKISEMRHRNQVLVIYAVFSMLEMVLNKINVSANKMVSGTSVVEEFQYFKSTLQENWCKSYDVFTYVYL
jgi:hypothetical protein